MAEVEAGISRLPARDHIVRVIFLDMFTGLVWTDLRIRCGKFKILSTVARITCRRSLGWWRSINRSRHVFTSTSPDTSPPADYLIDMSPFANWNPQVLIFL